MTKPPLEKVEALFDFGGCFATPSFLYEEKVSSKSDNETYKAKIQAFELGIVLFTGH